MSHVMKKVYICNVISMHNPALEAKIIGFSVLSFKLHDSDQLVKNVQLISVFVLL